MLNSTTSAILCAAKAMSSPADKKADPQLASAGKTFESVKLHAMGFQEARGVSGNIHAAVGSLTPISSERQLGRIAFYFADGLGFREFFLHEADALLIVWPSARRSSFCPGVGWLEEACRGLF